MENSALSIPQSALLRRWLPFGVAVSFIVLWAIAFPPFNQAWAILVFLTPFIKWAFARPKWKTFLLTSFLAGSGAWFLILIWLRHIYPPWGWLGLALLSAYLGFYVLAWMAALRWTAPKLIAAPRWQRLAGLFALAGWWIVLDWLRGWLFSGIPWLPLAAAFWKFPLFLQPLQWTGHWSITLAIVLFNLGVVCGTGPEPVAEGEPASKRKIFWPARIGWELLAPILLFMGAVFLASVLMRNPQRQNIPLLRVGVVQPATPAEVKWVGSDTELLDIWNTLKSLSQNFAFHENSPRNVDLVLWPEAAPPFYVQGPHRQEERALLEKFTNSLGRPILFGAVGEVETSANKNDLGHIDGVFLVQPEKGFAQETYAKRHLVPFGEYNPLPKWLPISDFKVVQVMGDTVPGDKAAIIPIIYSNNRVARAGPLVCYEDIFPNLAADEARAGADFLVVVTNDAWFGHGGGSIQHAAHSVLRAIETRRPIVRCGNQGWSGFIDQDGNAFEVEKVGKTTLSEWVLRARGSTYFRGTGAFIVYTNPQFDGQETFYVRHGDWFVALAALLVVGGMGILAKKRP